MNNEITLTPIGYYHGNAQYKFDAPRQGIFGGEEGQITLLPHHNFEEALRDLDGFDRIWVIFIFNRNGTKWRPTTKPPVPPQGKERIGTFASRSPYRPNPIGLSCVRLLSIKGLTLNIAESDLLTDTPILDIKPYIPSADSFPNATPGWLKNCEQPWMIEEEPLFHEQATYIRTISNYDIENVAKIQLQNSPQDTTRKRITITPQDSILSIRMYRIHYTIFPNTHSLKLTHITTGYTPQELTTKDDPYQDKIYHKAFVTQFSNSLTKSITDQLLQIK